MGDMGSSSDQVNPAESSTGNSSALDAFLNTALIIIRAFLLSIAGLYPEPRLKKSPEKGL
jgi:hypothetical protein